MSIDLKREREYFEASRRDKLKNVRFEINHYCGSIYVGNTSLDYDEAYDLNEQWFAWQQRAEIHQVEINDLKQQIKELHASRESLLAYKDKIENPDYVLVPRLPTQEMLDAFPEVEVDAVYTGDFMYHITDKEVTVGYKAMISASQK